MNWLTAMRSKSASTDAVRAEIDWRPDSAARAMVFATALKLRSTARSMLPAAPATGPETNSLSAWPAAASEVFTGSFAIGIGLHQCIKVAARHRRRRATKPAIDQRAPFAERQRPEIAGRKPQAPQPQRHQVCPGKGTGVSFASPAT